MSARSIHRRCSRAALLVAVLASVVVWTSCSRSSTNQASKTTIRLWHFWSEPVQRNALQLLVKNFEQEHPDLIVELTELSWTDGKAKLQSAFATGTAPDIVHLGLEWVQEFASAGVLLALDSQLVQSVPDNVRSSVSTGTNVYAMPWVMNTRALFVRNDVLQAATARSSRGTAAASVHLQMLRTICSEQLKNATIGVQSFEPHNVLKKVLPFLWSSGSRIFSTVPLSASVDSNAVAGLEEYCAWARAGIIEPSRMLDARLRRRELGVWISGMWNLSDTAITNHYTVMPLFPTVSGEISGALSEAVSEVVSEAASNVLRNALRNALRGSSICSADCFALSASTSVASGAKLLLQYLSSPGSELQFCALVPDAGFPCTNIDTKDTGVSMRTVFNRPLARNFYAQVQASIVLPSPPYFLQAEEILEQEVMEAVYARKTPSRALQEARQRLAVLEATPR
jgi:maltose-binding protein MalE